MFFGRYVQKNTGLIALIAILFADKTGVCILTGLLQSWTYNSSLRNLKDDTHTTLMEVVAIKSSGNGDIISMWSEGFQTKSEQKARVQG